MGEFLSANWLQIVRPLGIMAFTMAVGWAIRKLFFKWLTGWAKRSHTHVDDILVAAIRVPSLLWLAILAIYLGLLFSGLPNNAVDIVNKALLVLAILSITLFTANLAARLVITYSTKNGALPTTSLFINIARFVIIGIGVLIIIKGVFSVDISPLLATLGIGGLAVALALQDTLSNLFAGIYIAASRQIRVGDYVKLDSGEEGYVTDIHWRATRIRMLANNMVIVPNEKLSKVIVTNYDLPEKELAVLVNLGVHYSSDLRKVEKVTIDVARQVMKEVAGGVPQFEPFIRYNTFGDYSIGFTVILRGKEFVDQYMIKHEFIKRLHERYNTEGIVIPYPIRAINYEQEEQKPE